MTRSFALARCWGGAEAVCSGLRSPDAAHPARALTSIRPVGSHRGVRHRGLYLFVALALVALLVCFARMTPALRASENLRHLAAVLLMAGVGLGITFQRARVWWRSPWQQGRRALRDAPAVRIVDLVEGQVVKVVGLAEALAGTVHAPLSKRACVGFEVVVLEPQGRGPRREIIHETRSVDFVVRDEDASVVVRAHAVCVGMTGGFEGHSAFWGNATPEVHAALEAYLQPHGETATSLLGGIRTLWWREGLVEPGGPVAVLGLCRRIPDVEGDPRARFELVAPPERATFLSNAPEALGTARRVVTVAGRRTDLPEAI